MGTITISVPRPSGAQGRTMYLHCVDGSSSEIHKFAYYGRNYLIDAVCLAGKSPLLTGELPFNLGVSLP